MPLRRHKMGTYDRLNQLNRKNTTEQAKKASLKSGVLIPDNSDQDKKGDRRASFTLPNALLDRMFRYKAQLELKKGKTVTKSDIVRIAVEQFLAEESF